MQEVSEFIYNKIRELVSAGWSVDTIASECHVSPELIVTLGKLRQYDLPDDFVTSGDYPSKTLRDDPDTYWNVDLIEEYNETPHNKRLGLGEVPVWHSLKMRDPFMCANCGKVTMFEFEDTRIPDVYIMRCVNKCGYSFIHDCTPRRN